MPVHNCSITTCPILGCTTHFAERWDKQYPAISKLWCRHWDHVTPFFAFPQEIREVIYTTNAIESMNRGLRKIIKTRGAFPTDEAP